MTAGLQRTTDVVLAALAFAARPAREADRRFVMPAWGSPMRVLEPVESKRRPPREDGPAWGRTVTLTPQPQKTGVIRVSLEHSEPLLLSIDVLVGAAPKGATSYHVWAQITFGGGDGSAVRNVNCDYRFDVPICASYVDVMLYLGDAAGVPITTPNAATQVQVAAQLARGIRWLPRSATIFTVGQGVSSATAGAPQIIGPARLVSITGHQVANVNFSHSYLQLFDTTSAPAAGSKPVMEVIAGEFDQFIVTQFGGYCANTRAFANGIWYEMSTTSGLLTRPPAGDHVMWIELETLVL